MQVEQDAWKSLHALKKVYGCKNISDTIRILCSVSEQSEKGDAQKSPTKDPPAPAKAKNAPCSPSVRDPMLDTLRSNRENFRFMTGVSIESFDWMLGKLNEATKVGSGTR